MHRPLPCNPVQKPHFHWPQREGRKEGKKGGREARKQGERGKCKGRKRNKEVVSIEWVFL